MGIFDRNQKGFTLIELSIVLVIIGIILAAVLKGQDLIDNSKAKKVASLINQWQVPMGAYYDRKGYWPGDSGIGAGSVANGIIANINALTTSLNAATISHPDPVVGEINVQIQGGAVCNGSFGTRNYMVLTLPSTATQSLIETIDSNIDGTAIGTSGRLLNCGDGTQAPAAWSTTSTVLTYIF
ncbi:MAG: prepilin-type N-terminal cleavage/methylation domain-containing protein [Nitrospirae bacterium]|nr:prepilin-type N-terminal cleavage/methylation domain-containing protein [Nitrospirota bacterium]